MHIQEILHHEEGSQTDKLFTLKYSSSVTAIKSLSKLNNPGDIMEKKKQNKTKRYSPLAHELLF